MLIAHISDFHIFSREPETAPVRRDAAFVAVAGSSAFLAGTDVAERPQESSRTDELSACFARHSGAAGAVAFHTRYVSIR